MARTNADWKVISARDIMRSRGRVIMRVNRGQFVSQAWPRKRGKPKSSRQQTWVNHFSYLQCLSNMVDPATLRTMQHLAKGNGWYPRDMFIAAANGQLFGVQGEVKVMTPTASLSRASAESLSAGLAKVLTPDTLGWDNAQFWDSTTHPSRLTVKKPGLYLCGYDVVFSSSTSGNRGTWMQVNGAGSFGGKRVGLASGITTFFPSVSLQYFHKDDYVELVAQSSVGSVTAQIQQFWIVGIVPETQ